MRFDFEKWLNRLRPVRKTLDAISQKAQPKIEHWLHAWRGDPERPDADFIADADYYMIYQEPLRARLLVRTIGIVVAVSVILASVIQIDEITRGEGKVIPSRQLQILQSLDGGIVSEIAVQEGQVVEADQLLLQIDSTRFESSAREGQAQYSSLAAKSARLRALAEGTRFEPPAETLTSEPEIVEEERRLYEARSSELDAQLSISRQQLTQRQEELTEMRAKRDQASQAYDLSARELAVTRPLLASGAISEVELLRLERDVSRFRGERDMATAQIARVQSAVAEASKRSRRSSSTSATRRARNSPRCSASSMP
jgi:adhesin transport system membrane fusion protein